MKPERQLGFLWGVVAILLIALSPVGPHLAASLPPCPVRTLLDFPCPSCGTTRAALALARIDLPAAVAANPLAAFAWMGLIVGGVVAGFLALVGRPLREPGWNASPPLRWFLVLLVLANWVYLLGIDA